MNIPKLTVRGDAWEGIAVRIAKIGEQVDAMNAFIQHVASPQFLAAIAALEDDLTDIDGRAEWMGSQGWTIPMWATAGQIRSLLDAGQCQPLDELPLDELFVQLYEQTDGANYELLKDGVLRRARGEKWEPLLKESFQAYEANFYRVPVPATLSILEGILRDSGGQSAWTRKGSKPSDIAKAHAAAARHGFVERSLWLSVGAFVESLFGDSPFTDARLPLINRHWILHGRDDPSLWGKADCLRLFQALNTVAPD